MLLLVDPLFQTSKQKGDGQIESVTVDLQPTHGWVCAIGLHYPPSWFLFRFWIFILTLLNCCGISVGAG